MSTALASLVLPLFVQPATAATAVPSRGWRQDAFWISFWVGPQVAEHELDGRFAEIAEANFTGYLGFNGNSQTPYTPNATRVAKEIALCAQHGLRCVPSLCGAPLGSPPADSPCIGLGAEAGSNTFWGWQLLDEPGASLFPRIGAWVQQLEAARPGLLNYINLLGDAPFPTPDAYDAYIAGFVADVKPQVISMDFYPQFPAAAPTTPTPASASDRTSGRMPEDKESYGVTLGVLRRQAEMAAGGPIPFWAFFNAMPFSPAHSDPTEAMIRWQALTALTYGASGVMYFCYWSPAHVFKLGGGLLVPRGKPNGDVVYQRGPHWYEAQRINGVIRIHGGFLLGRRSIGVYRANTTTAAAAAPPLPPPSLGPGVGVPFTVDNATTPTPACVIASLSKTGPFDADWLIGVFDLVAEPRWGPVNTTVNAGGARLAVPKGSTHAVVLQNQDENRNVWSTVQWASSVDNTTILELDPVQGVLRPLLDDSPWDPGLQVAIDAGGARLFVLQVAH